MAIKKSLLVMALFVFIPLAVAQIVQTEYVTNEPSFIFKKDQPGSMIVRCFSLNQTYCLNTTTCQMSIDDPEGINIVANESMGVQNTFFNYTVSATNTHKVGLYNAFPVCQALNSQFAAFTFLVTPTGSNDDSFGSFILVGVVLIFSIGLIALGFNREEPYFIMFGGMALFLLGLFILLSGLGNYRNSLTEMTSFVIIGLASYITIRTGLELMNV